MEPTTLILICGLPGSGKTTLAKKLEAERKAIRMCPDEWIQALLSDPSDAQERDRLRDPVENLQWDLAQDYLQKGNSVILENGFWAEEERTLYAMVALDLGSRVELFYLHAPTFDKLWDRVARRNAGLLSTTWIMKRQDLLSAWNTFQMPDEEELSFYDQSKIVPWTDDPK